MSYDLLLPLSEVPGLDPVGLWVPSPHARRLVIEGPLLDVIWLAWSGKSDVPHQVGTPDLFLDLADASTRDRVARWVAERCGLDGSCTAHAWVPSGCGWLIGNRGRWRAWSADGRVGVALPTLDGLDRDDTAKLPDGSFRVDARALLLVAQHLGTKEAP